MTYSQSLQGFSAVKRQLILTDTPRIIYVDPQKMTVKGEIPWNSEISVDVKGARHFNITVVRFLLFHNLSYS